MKVWITAHCTSRRGVFAVEGTEVGHGWLLTSVDGKRILYKPHEWHRTEAAALYVAEHRCATRIAILERDASRLRRLQCSYQERAAQEGKLFLRLRRQFPPSRPALPSQPAREAGR